MPQVCAWTKTNPLEMLIMYGCFFCFLVSLLCCLMAGCLLALAASTWFLSFVISKGYSHFWNVLGARSSNQTKKKKKENIKPSNNKDREEIIEMRGRAKDYSNITKPDIDTRVRSSRPQPPEKSPYLVRQCFFKRSLSGLWKIVFYLPKLVFAVPVPHVAYAAQLG